MCAAESDKRMLNHPGLAILQSDICLIFQNTCGKFANMKKAKEVFQITGLHSFNICLFILFIFIFVHLIQKGVVTHRL